LFYDHMVGLFSLLLWTAALLCFLAVCLDPTQVEYVPLGAVLATVTFLTGCFSFWQDHKADAAMAGFANMLPPEVDIYRDGKQVRVPAVELAVGDVVIMKPGDKVPADIRVIFGNSIAVNNSALTGENLPQKRNGAVSTFEEPLEATNMLYYGTDLTNGTGEGIVVRTGDDTAMGQIAHLVREAGSAGDTPIAIEIHHFIKIVTGVAVFLGVTFVAIGFVIGLDPIYNLVFGIGIIVANVPEGLLATVTVSLTLTSTRMKEKQVLVKNLEAVETLVPQL